MDPRNLNNNSPHDANQVIVGVLPSLLQRARCTHLGDRGDQRCEPPHRQPWQDHRHQDTLLALGVIAAHIKTQRAVGLWSPDSDAALD
jgi:hypothetical protein